MVLPLLKLGTLVLKTLSKPIAQRLKIEAGKHPKFRDYIIVLAQANHRITTQMQRRLYGHATDVLIRPLNEEKAVQAAVDLLGETFVFSVGGAAIIFEWQRSSRSEAKKEEQRRQEKEALRQRDEQLAEEIEILKRQVQELGKIAQSRGISGIFNMRHDQPQQTNLPTAIASKS